MAGEIPKRLNPFECHVLDTARRRGLLERGDRVLVAFSGGADSTALLRALVALRGEMGLRLHAAHVEHGIHAQSRSHGEHCARVAAEFGAPLERRAVDARGVAARRGVSLEHGARLARYEALEDMASVTGSRRIATGHTADDRAESVLLNLIRGTGLDGLTGVPARRGRVIRPLIDVSRAEILRYLADRDMQWVEDPTNDEDDALRNRVRRHLLPEMERVARRSVVTTLARLSDTVELDREALDAAGSALLGQCRADGGQGGALELSVAALRALSEGAASVVLRAAAREVLGPGAALSLAQIRQALGLIWSDTARGEQKLEGCLFVRDRGKLTLSRVEPPGAPDA